MTRLIAVASGKGGVGKTTTVVNLGAALTQFNKNVIILDANLTTPNVGLHLGMHKLDTNLNDVMAGNASLVDAIYMHESGLRVIPAGLHLKHLRTSAPEKLWDIVLDLFGSSEAVILDTPAGLERGAQAVLDAGEEVVIVTNPELPAVTDALKTVRTAYESGAYVLGAVVNKHRDDHAEMNLDEIESMLDIPILATIPHDDEVRKSIKMNNPVVFREPESPASRSYKKLASELFGVNYELPAKGIGVGRFLKKLFGI